MKQKANAFDVINVILVVIVVMLVVIPVWYIFVISTSKYEAYIGDHFHLIPRSFTLQEYQRALMRSRDLMTSFWTSIKVTTLGTSISMGLTVLAGYALSKPSLPGRKFIFNILLFTMFFSGGLAPNYMLVRSLGIINSIWSLTLPMAASTYNIILMKNFFAGINPSLEEAAKIDGYNDLQILFHIILPTSKPAIAAISLFYAVAYWNSYFLATLYSSSKSLVPFQLYLRNLVIVNVAAARAGVATGQPTYEQFKMAVIIVGIIPVVAIYPFVQKYFTKGIVLGSTKE